MRSAYDMVVVVPIGPGTPIKYISDTIDSVYFYCRCGVKLILADDSQQGLGNLVKEKYTDADNLVNKRSNGLAAGLYITLALAYQHAVRHYSFKTLFKIDTDALVIGPDPQKDAEKLFVEQPAIGLAGLYKSGNSIIDFNGNAFDNSWPRNYLFDITCTWKVIKRPVANFTLRKYFRKAFANGYNIGENVFGGAYFLSEALIIAMDRAQLLPVYGLKNSRMEEDHIFSILAKSINFDIGDLGRDELPFGVFWKRLPASPEMLVLRNKKIIHSTRSWEQLDESDIRAYFLSRRQTLV